MTWAFGQRVGSPMGKLVLLALADRHDDETGADPFPMIGTIAAETEMNERSVRRHLEALEAAGLIGCRDRGRGRVLPLEPPVEAGHGGRRDARDTGLCVTDTDSVSMTPDPLSKTPETESAEPEGTDSNRKRTRERARKRANRATRLPDDWQPHQAEFDFALKEGLDDGLDCGRTRPCSRNRDFRVVKRVLLIS